MGILFKTRGKVVEHIKKHIFTPLGCGNALKRDCLRITLIIQILESSCKSFDISINMLTSIQHFTKN
jgi:hypothetical protein